VPPALQFGLSVPFVSRSRHGFQGERIMTKSSRFITCLAIATVAVGLLCLALAPAGHAAPAKSPYRSALTAAGTGTAWTAQPPKCNNRICEFVAPAQTCLFEGTKTSCTLVSGGCTTIDTCR
jgi:hypothetical protein